jgi:hypothetical protein
MSPEAGSSQQTTSHAGEVLPEQIGRYRILGRLGSGGMGVVYKAHDPHLNRVVALKMPHFQGSPESVARRVQRFQREGRAAARVLHPHVCPVLDMGEHEGCPFAVMAYVEGRSLEQRLAESGAPEDVGAAVRLLLQVLEGLAAVHAAGIIHRDLKPANILLDAAARPVLTDFGLARPEHDGEPLTSDGVVMGTPHYMAPEQATGQIDRVGPWTDVYGAGVVLYRMLTGRLPFEGPPLAVLSQIANDPVPPPSRWRPDLSPGLEAALQQALAKDPARRPGGALAFAEGLKPWASAAPTPAPTDKEEPRRASGASAGGRPSSRRRSRPLLQWQRYLAMAALLLGLGGAWEAVVFARPAEEPWQGLLFTAGTAPVTGAVIFLVIAVRWRVALTPRNLLRCAAGTEHDYPIGPLLARDILRFGIDVDCTDDLGETALQKAAQSGQSELVKVLLAHGADVTHKNQFGQTALQIAVRKDHADVVDLLRRAGATE